VPWLLVPGPVAGAVRLSTDCEMSLTRIADDVHDWIGIQTKFVKYTMNTGNAAMTILGPVAHQDVRIVSEFCTSEER
jgi:hypothetical protein